MPREEALDAGLDLPESALDAPVVQVPNPVLTPEGKARMILGIHVDTVRKAVAQGIVDATTARELLTIQDPDERSGRIFAAVDGTPLILSRRAPGNSQTFIASLGLEFAL